MVKYCSFENCKIIPSFNYENEKTTLFCSKHKLKNMVDVKHKTCIFENCKKRPHFNCENEKTALFCSKHKLENMVDVKHKTCIFENCKTIPNFNYENEKQAIYCSKHKKENMINIKHKTCIFENCKILPIFNYENETTALFCSEHKLENMIDIKHKRCKTHLCDIRPSEKYDGFCLRCYMFMFPDKQISRNYKTKEQSVLEFVKNNFGLDKTIIADKKISGGCSKKRPDILIDLGFQVLIIEIDENQHNSYDCSCENKRIMELSQDIGHRPIIFIRFNPDDYKGKNNKLIKSCWCSNNSGICVVKKQKINEWNERLEILKQTIEYWLNNKTDKTIEIIQLFYDLN